MSAQTPTKTALRQELHRLIDLLPTERMVDILKVLTAQLRYETIPATKPINGSSKPSKVGRTSPQPASTLKLFATALKNGYEGDALLDTEALYDDN